MNTKISHLVLTWISKPNLHAKDQPNVRLVFFLLLDHVYDIRIRLTITGQQGRLSS